MMMRRIGYELVSNMRRAFPEVVGHEMRDEDAGCMREANLWNPMPPYGVSPEAWTPPSPRPLYGVASMEVDLSSRPIMRGETFWRERVFEPVHELRGWTIHSALFDTGDVRTIALYCRGDAATFVLTETFVAFPDDDVQDLRMRETTYTYSVALSAVFIPRCAALYSLIDEGHTTLRSWRMLWDSFTAIADVVREAPCMCVARSGARAVYTHARPLEFGCPAEAARFDGTRWTALVRAFEPLAVAMHGVGSATVRVVDGTLGEGRVGGAKQWFWALDAQRTLFVRGANELNSGWMVGLIVVAGG